MQPTISIPPTPAGLLRRLEEAGYEAYVVGGCVRDSLRGAAPDDWDICTSARPEQTAACFSHERVVPTGVDHGTVTVVLDGVGYEITTFRTEGGYADHRHPDRVEFVASVTDDLSRRDFTVNAMAYHPQRGLRDPFGGREDLSRRMIRCVRDAPRSGLRRTHCVFCARCVLPPSLIFPSKRKPPGRCGQWPRRFAPCRGSVWGAS